MASSPQLWSVFRRAIGSNLGIVAAAVMAAAAASGCAREALRGLCDGRASVDADGDGHYTPDSCLAPNDDCDDDNSAAYPGGVESCDGVDNNCDGVTDDGFGAGQACVTGDAQCGSKKCNDAGDGVVCVGFTPGPELCDGLDNDCNGAVDDGFGTGVDCEVGLGACYASGVMVCKTDGTGSECSVPAGEPTAEICDGFDNNCDGTVDEGFGVGIDCDVGQGSCRRVGVQVCTADGSRTVCGVAAGQATTEICDGLDNDCDGSVDEGFGVGVDCEVGIGGCWDAGMVVCTAANAVPHCDAVAGTPSVETCDGIDNNCDGTVDEQCTIDDGGMTTFTDLNCEDCAHLGPVYTWDLNIGGGVLPGLADRMRDYPQPFGIYRNQTRNFAALGCTNLTAVAGSPGSYRCNLASPYVGIIEHHASSAAQVFSIQITAAAYPCGAGTGFERLCYGNPSADPFFLCWHGEDAFFCSDTMADDMVFISCARDVETLRPSPWSVGIVGTNGGKPTSVSFGDGTTVSPASWDSGTYWTDDQRTEAFVEAGKYTLVHTYATAQIYAITAHWDDYYSTGPRNETWLSFTPHSTRDDAAACPSMFSIP